ncbi:MAG: phosphoglycerate dehydrogenase [Phycisphaerae bacterium]|nr:phosphoglycerate dehydrogenase [Phycisphaerae bacterium]
MKTSFPKDKIRVVLLEGIHPAARRMLADEGLSVTLMDTALEGAALDKAVAGAHLVGIRSKTQLSSATLASAQRLLAVGCFCIGTNQVDLKAAQQRGVAVFNAPFSNTRSVAELTIAEVVALHRRLADQSAAVHAGRWDKSAEGAHEVRGRTLGIVGYGHIGSQVSVLAEAMGMRVLFFDIASKLPLGNARPCRTLDELLRQADCVSLHVPETPATRGLIGRAQLRTMKRGALLINNARGSVVDVPALAAALRDGHLGGAAADVFPHEPAGRGERFRSELQGLANVILTPHVGGSTEEAQEAIALDVCGKLLRFLNNGSTTGSVNMPVVDLPEQPGADEPRRSHRILHLHRNVPGVLGSINGACAALGVNISAQYLQTLGDVGYVVLEVDAQHGKRLLVNLRAMPETIRVRPLW